MTNTTPSQPAPAQAEKGAPNDLRSAAKALADAAETFMWGGVAPVAKTIYDVRAALAAQSVSQAEKGAPSDLTSAARKVLEYRDGELPIRGWLRDSDASRAALQELADALADQSVKVDAGELPPLPEWTKRDDLGGKVPSEVRQGMREYANQALAAQSGAAGAVPAALTKGALNGIPATMFHDEGAYARCSYCKRYTLNKAALGVKEYACECGACLGWTGSFVKPDENAQWSGERPTPTTAATPKAGEAVAMKTIEYRVKSSASEGNWTRLSVSNSETDTGIEVLVSEIADRECGYSEHYRGYEWRHVANSATTAGTAALTKQVVNSTEKL